MEQGSFTLLFFLLIGWLIFLFVASALKLERFGLEVHPLYVMYKSTRLNTFLEKTGRRFPRLWRLLGNIGVASAVVEASFITYILIQNLYRFIYRPEQASQVAPLIPGVTIRFESLPWFLAAAGFVILVHELSHGIQCAVEGVPIKSSAVFLALVTFGGAVEPDEEAIESANMMSKLRIFASGSFTNIMTGLIIYLIFIVVGNSLPLNVLIFLWWVYFLSINLALMNMLPIYPLDGGNMLKTYLNTMKSGNQIIQKLTMYGFLILIASNIVLSLVKFGLVPLPF